MREKNGVTMISMVVTIVMIILLAAFSVYNSRDTVSEAKLSKIYNEVKEVKGAVMRYVVISDKSNLARFSCNHLPSRLASYETSNSELYYLDFSNKENKGILEDILEIRNIENDYYIDVYDLNNIKIYLKDGIKISNKMCDTDEQIIMEYNDVFAGTRN